MSENALSGDKPKAPGPPGYCWTCGKRSIEGHWFWSGRHEKWRWETRCNGCNRRGRGSREGRSYMDLPESRGRSKNVPAGGIIAANCDWELTYEGDE